MRRYDPDTDLVRRTIIDIARQVKKRHETFYADVPLAALALSIRRMVVLCQEHGILELLNLRRIALAVFDPAPETLDDADLTYLMHMITMRNASEDGRALAVETFMASKKRKKDE